ncbi:DNA primase [Frankliniella fusca]|uniref:DNA primase n=1 Tax=Frankliniella fusca TaxID=407009 RepID=A0AAE1LE78_9NEOP|nr:DNA primase [Frankliniella fusca]
MQHVTRREVYAIYREKARFPLAAKIEHVTDTLLARFKYGDGDNNKAKDKEEIRRLCYEFYRRSSKRGSLDMEDSVNKDWMDGTLNLTYTLTTPNSIGRPQKPFDQLELRQKRRRVEKFSAVSVAELALALEIRVRKEGKEDLAKLLHAIFDDEDLASKIRSSYLKDLKSKPVEFLTPEESFALFIHMDLSRDSYQLLRNTMIAKNLTEMFPSYYKLQEVADSCCPDPTDIVVTNSSVEINLQALLNHTAKRLIKLHELSLLALR